MNCIGRDAVQESREVANDREHLHTLFEANNALVINLDQQQIFKSISNPVQNLVPDDGSGLRGDDLHRSEQVQAKNAPPAGTHQEVTFRVESSTHAGIWCSKVSMSIGCPAAQLDVLSPEVQSRLPVAVPADRPRHGTPNQRTGCPRGPREKKTASSKAERMKCDLCETDEAVTGKMLCPVCYEALLRAATAWERVTQKPSHPETPTPTVRVMSPEEYRAAFAGGRTSSN